MDVRDVDLLEVGALDGLVDDVVGDRADGGWLMSLDVVGRLELRARKRADLRLGIWTPLSEGSWMEQCRVDLSRRGGGRLRDSSWGPSLASHAEGGT